jgi:hypothetical protein
VHLQEKVFRPLLCLVAPIYIPIIAKVMIRQEESEEINPLDCIGDDEDTEEEENPLLGREGSARRLGRDFRTGSAAAPLSLDEIRRSLGMEPFVALDTRSSITSDELLYLRSKYQIPDSVTLRVPSAGERACSSSRDEICLYQHAFEAGLRLPFPRIVREILNYFSLAPSQPVPNAWRHLVGSAALWAASSNKKTPLTLNTFCYLFQLKKSPSAVGWWYFSPRDREKEPLLTDVPSGVKDWKDRFFFVGGSGWEFPGYEDDQSPTISREWGSPPRSCKFLVHSLFPAVLAFSPSLVVLLMPSHLGCRF